MHLSSPLPTPFTKLLASPVFCVLDFSTHPPRSPFLICLAVALFSWTFTWVQISLTLKRPYFVPISAPTLSVSFRWPHSFNTSSQPGPSKFSMTNRIYMKAHLDASICRRHESPAHPFPEDTTVNRLLCVFLVLSLRLDLSTYINTYLCSEILHKWVHIIIFFSETHLFCLISLWVLFPSFESVNLPPFLFFFLSHE